MAQANELSFFIDADDEYQPEEVPTGTVKMGGTTYAVRCPKDSLPMLLNRIQSQAVESQDPAAQETLMRQLLSACFDEDATAEILERIIDPNEPGFSVAFLVHTVQRVYTAFAPLLDKGYEELGIENPVKQPQDRKPPAARKRAAAKKTTAKKTAARAR